MWGPRRRGWAEGSTSEARGLGWSGWTWECSWLLGALGLQRQGMDLPADLGPEDLVDEAVLLDPAASLKRGGGDGRAEVIATTGVVLDLRLRARNRVLDALLDLVGRGQFIAKVSRDTLESDDHDE